MDNRVLKALLATTLALSAFLGWYIFFDPAPVKRSPNNAFLTNQSGSQGSGQYTIKRGVVALSEHEANSPYISRDGKTVSYYEKGTGRVFETDIQSHNRRTISEKKLPNFVETIWSPTGREVVSVFYKATGPSFIHYNYSTGRSAPLPNDVVSVAFSPNGNELAFVRIGEKSSGVYLAQSDGSQPYKILSTRAPSAYISWPLPNHLTLETRNSLGGSDLLVVERDGSLQRLISLPGSLEYAWSPDGKLLLVSSLGTTTANKLFILDMHGQQTKIALDTIAQRCVWSKNSASIWCAVKTSSGSDEFFEIPLAGDLKPILRIPRNSLSSDVMVKQLWSWPDDHSLVFIDARDQKLYFLEK